MDITCSVMIQRSWARTSAGSNLECVVLLSKVDFESKIYKMQYIGLI